MKRMSIVLWMLIASCLFCGCDGEKRSNQEEIELTLQKEAQTSLSPKEDEDIDVKELEIRGYRYSLPATDLVHESKGDGALYRLESCDLYLHKLNSLEFTSWDETVEQCKDKLSSAIYGAFRFWPTSQTAATETPFTNEHGVEMMRVTGELRENNNDPVPYIAYYYVTDENYVRFMLALNYEDEAKAAEVIDFVAERLEPLEKA